MVLAIIQTHERVDIFQSSGTIAPMGWLYNTIIYAPLYNALIYFVAHMPAGDIGLAVVILTIGARLILSPLSYKSIKSQIEMKALAPKIQELQAKYKDDKARLSQETFALYKEHKVNPFSGCLAVLLQLPIIFALYKVFINDLSASADLLYSNLVVPATISYQFLGFFDISEKSLVLALIAGLAQFAQIRYTMGKANTETNVKATTTQEVFTQAMTKQMQYVLPVIAFIFSYTISAVIALYWATTAIFSLAQEFIVRQQIEKRRLRKEEIAGIRDVSAQKVQ